MLAENFENLMMQLEQRGKLEGQLEQAIKMIRDFNLPVKKVAEQYKLSFDELMRRLNQGDHSIS
ncbi:hypothetical protein [Thiomicrospira microaerophila]|uniref:hypothetical protein n=1 Tax=Thiomicrospira microaerophila TaxID=406020 RepID=UPI0005CA7252|nr:hypothetical protein [Thiomicrospira microaerophila]